MEHLSLHMYVLATCMCVACAFEMTQLMRDQL